MTENISTTNSFNEKFLSAYRQEKSDPTNPNHQFDSKTATDGKLIPHSIAQNEPTDAEALAKSVLPTDLPLVFGNPVIDYINTLLPNGAPEGSRHKMALKVATDLIILRDDNEEQMRADLLSISWVQDVIKERGTTEIDRIIETARKRLQKRETESLSDPQPSKEMRRAIETVCGRKYSELVREAHQQALGNVSQNRQTEVINLLERIGTEIEKLFPYFPLLKLLCHRQKRKHYIAALFVGGAFSMTLMTRCWYRFWPAPGRQCRLNSLLALIGRMGSGKHIAVDFYKILMEPIEKADQAQVNALNQWNKEREQNSGANKNKAPRPEGCYRRLPPETSAAGAREAEGNAHENVDGQDMPLHVSIFDSELDNTLRQMKKSYMEAMFTLWLKCYHNEPHGSFLKTSSAKVGEYDVHFNGVYTGTDDALSKLATEGNFVNGLLSRFTTVPMGDSNFEMMVAHEYDEEDQKRDDQLREWAYNLDSTKGEIPCKDISDALHEWTARRMADAAENDSLTEEDLVKRPCWHGINYALPVIVSRHWDMMVEEGSHWKCGPDFTTDKYDRQLAILIAQAQLAFQEHFFKAIGERYYDNRMAETASNTQHQQKTLLAYRRLPNPCTSEDIDRAYGYNGKTGSICSRLKRLQDDGLLQKIRTGADKGKYRKLT